MRRKTAYLWAVGTCAIAPVSVAVAQDAETLPPPPPPAPVFSLPPGNTPEPQNPNIQGPSDPEAPRQRPRPQRPAPAPAAQQAPSQQPATRPTQTTRPQPRPSPPTQRNLPRPGPAAQSPAQPQTPTQPADIPEPPATDLPPLTFPDPASETVTPDAQDTTSAPETPPQIAPQPDSEGLPWLWIMLGVLAAILATGALVFRRSRSTDEMPEDFSDIEPRARTKSDAKPTPTPKPQSSAPKPKAEPDLGVEPAPSPVFMSSLTPGVRPAQQPAALKSNPAPQTPVSQPPPPTVSSSPARLGVEFAPFVARLTPIGLNIAFKLDLQTLGDQAVTDISVWLAVRCAEQLSGSAITPTELPDVYIKSLAAGDEHRHHSELQLKKSQFKLIQLDGKSVIIPMIDMIGRYTDAEGTVHKKNISFLVGQENTPQTVKMMPFPLNNGFVEFPAIGCRVVDMPTKKTVAA